MVLQFSPFVAAVFFHNTAATCGKAQHIESGTGYGIFCVSLIRVVKTPAFLLYLILNRPSSDRLDQRSSLVFWRKFDERIGAKPKERPTDFDHDACSSRSRLYDITHSLARRTNIVGTILRRNTTPENYNTVEGIDCELSLAVRRLFLLSSTLINCYLLKSTPGVEEFN